MLIDKPTLFILSSKSCHATLNITISHLYTIMLISHFLPSRVGAAFFFLDVYTTVASGCLEKELLIFIITQFWIEMLSFS